MQKLRIRSSVVAERRFNAQHIKVEPLGRRYASREREEIKEMKSSSR